MATHSHQQSRRSLSIFSLDHIRSLSRAGTRSAQLRNPNSPLRSPSSLSCDPYDQPPASPEPTATISNVLAQGLIECSKPYSVSNMATARLRSRVVGANEQENTRPRSWFSFPSPSIWKAPARSLSVQLPKGASSPSVVRSIISAPVLTGTTNIDVAESEGVCCRDIVDVGLTTPVESIEGKEDVSGSNNGRLNKLRLFRKPNTRRHMKNKTSGCLPDVTSFACPEGSAPVSDDTWRFSTAEKGIARRRAETINLCRDKINKLTGHGTIRRKSLRKDNTGTLDTGSDDTIAQPHASETNTGETRFLNFNHSNPDLAFGSLTRSFASAIDKLDFHTSSLPANMAFVKSKSSIFNLRKRNKPTDGTESSQSGVEPSKAGSNPSNDLKGQRNVHPTTGMTISREVAKQLQHPCQTHGLEKGCHPEPMQFSGTANTYIPAEPTNPYPKGIKVLGMHSNTMEFATAPSWVTDLPIPPRHTPTVEEVTPVDDEEENAIQDAPIYSPSLGDLSQYARPTPPPAQPVVESDRHLEPETPTHNQAEKSYRRRLGLRKSKSGLGLLSMFNRAHREQKEHSRPLSARDSNQPVIESRQIKKSRSMNLAALLRKSDKSAEERLLRKGATPSSLPVKPSPLRFEASVDAEPAEQCEGLCEAQRRSPSQDNVTPSERTKRMGMIGMPQASIEKRRAKH